MKFFIIGMIFVFLVSCSQTIEDNLIENRKPDTEFEYPSEGIKLRNLGKAPELKH